jgi:hypothetical protein
MLVLIAALPHQKFGGRQASASGAERYVYKEVVVDRNWVTSHKSDDIPAFNREMLALFSGALESARLAAR